MLLKKVIQECTRLKLGLQPWEFDRAHRIGREYFVLGRPRQAVIIKFVSWRARNAVYEARRDSHYKWYADLTAERHDTLMFAKDQANSMDFIDFVFSDRNCILMLKTKSGQFYSFSNKVEFMTLCCKLEAGFDEEERYDRKYEDYLRSETDDELSDDVNIEDFVNEVNEGVLQQGLASNEGVVQQELASGASSSKGSPYDDQGIKQS